MAYKVEYWLIGIVAFSAIVLTGNLLIADANTNYGTTIGSSSEFARSSAQANTSYTTMNSISQNMNNAMFNNTGSFTTRLDSIISGSFSAFSFIPSTFSLMYNVMADTAQSIGVPSFLVSMAFIVLVILITISLIYLFTGRTQ